MILSRLEPLFAACVLAAILAFAATSASQDHTAWTIETVAGNGQPGELPYGALPALEVPVDQPFGVECGPDGALYITSVGQHRILRVDTKIGELFSVAGSGKSGYSGDGGPATEAQLNEPYEVRFDATGHYMYFVEMKNHLIRRVDLHTGVISTVAGIPRRVLPATTGPPAKPASASRTASHSTIVAISTWPTSATIVSAPLT